MECEFEGTDEIVLAQILNLLTVVVRVVDLHLVLLRLLEMEVAEDLSDKLWVEVVVDDLGLPQFLPHISLLLVHDHEGVREGHRVHIWKLFALKANRKFI